MMYPLVSVVIPTYGRSHLLTRAIDSVLNQTYTNLEIIVVDDNDSASEHRRNTEKVLQKYIEKNQIQYLKHEKNSGGSAARNTGILASKGEYVALLDDDDEWFSHKIEKQIEYFSKLDDNVGVIYCSYLLEEFNGCVEYRRTQRGDLTKDLLMLEFDPGASSTLVFRKYVLTNIENFDESFARNQDLEILIRICRKYSIEVCPDILLKINGHNFPSAQKIESVKKHFFKTFKRDIKKFSFITRRKIYAKHYIELSSLFFSERDFHNTLKYYFIAIIYYMPLLFKNKVNTRLRNFVFKKIGISK